MYLQLSH